MSPKSGTCESQEQVVVKAILTLIKENGGRLEGTQLSQVYKQCQSASAIVAKSGGPRKFCERHIALKVVATTDGPWHVERSAAGAPKTKKKVQLFDDSTPAGAAKMLLGMLEMEGPKLEGGKIGLLCSAHPAIKASGGPRKFCEERDEFEVVAASCGQWHVERRPTEQDIVRMLSDLIAKEGGKLDSCRIGTIPSIRQGMSAAGGPRKFCEQQDALVVVSGSSGAWHLECPTQCTQCPSIGLQEVPLSQIRWSQDCIKVSFRNGGMLVDLLKEMTRDPELMHRLPMLSVVKHEGQLFAISGNRRLWVLKEYAALNDPTLKIRVCFRDMEKKKWAKLFKMRFSTENRGQQVDIVLAHKRMKIERFSTMKLAVEALRRQTAHSSDSDSESASGASSSQTTPSSSSSSGCPALRSASFSSGSSD